jgi:hypothetical protein
MGIGSIGELTIDKAWIYILGLAFGSKVFQKFGEEEESLKAEREVETPGGTRVTEKVQKKNGFLRKVTTRINRRESSDDRRRVAKVGQRLCPHKRTRELETASLNGRGDTTIGNKRRVTGLQYA